MKMRTYITTVVILFGLLILSRIPQLINSGLSPLIIVSSIVELAFMIWGVLVLKKNRRNG